MRFLVVWLIPLLLAACSTQQTVPARSPHPGPPSGFLPDYGLLVPDPADPGHRRYVSPQFVQGGYRSFLIQDPVFFINTRQAYAALDPARLRAISDYYKSRMSEALARRSYRVTNTPGPGVARLRVAVVSLVEVSPPFKVRDLVPASALFNVVRMAADESPHMLQMSIEAELLDSQTGQLLGEAVDDRESKTTVAGQTTPPSEDQLHSLIDFWVERFVGQLDRPSGH